MATWKVTAAYRKMDTLYLVLQNQDTGAQMSFCYPTGTSRATIVAAVKLELVRQASAVDVTSLPVAVGEVLTDQP